MLAILAYTAIIGFLGRIAWRSGETEKVMFIVNVALLWLSAIWLFGYPALIVPAVLAAIGFLALLVIITAGDLRISVDTRPPHGDDES
ncbi:hypothetical protein ACK6D9_15585 [Hoeflea sp. Naph1]|uniref:hypothetical protein n=1 Tax=Hoeflea sp. Naph1 TaxID=3388653 RepID=UPI00398FB107